MIISRTPYRISFFGGGTDYPAWFREHGGAVLTTTIDKYCFLSVRYLPPFFEHRTRVVWSMVEHVNSVDEIQHPSVRECLRFTGLTRGLEVHHHGDLPARSGMGSSSAFTVGLLHALYALKGEMPSKSQLASDAITVEQDRIGENVGCQDQTIAAFGGLRRIEFLRNGERHVAPVILSRNRLDELQQHLMLVFTGTSRNASEIADEQVRAVGDRARELRTMYHMVDEGLALLTGGDDIARFGQLLHESWMLKRSLSSKVTTSGIDELYEAARGAGAIGGKLLGAGGGGFFLFFVRPEDRARLKQRLDGLVQVPFAFSSIGSEIIYYDGLPAGEDSWIRELPEPAAFAS
jgi:D-glycero-alpha-D-manno-heptose-7-phosphate kinase